MHLFEFYVAFVEIAVLIARITKYFFNGWHPSPRVWGVVGQVAGQVAGWLVGWSAGWLAGWLENPTEDICQNFEELEQAIHGR